MITDRGMPEMGGDKLAAVIKEREPGTPIIMLTGFGEMMRSAREMPGGVDYVLNKPVTVTALREAINTVLSQA